ncbi:S-layer homology domain-containing protein [Paenibacillus ferrarius]|uniref:S-layer homology domain-containing protein n=1 Tax=Paenibacillus ferrarius TaxID=1469647 RepID=UPI003D26C27F
MSTSSSNNVRSNLKNNDTDIQGGEKKVMKKSLSVVLTTAMALSMFSSVAFGKTSADFTDLKDLDAATKAKFDAMISAGIFDGVSDTTFGLKEEMNRAQFAKVAALLLGLKADATTSSFSDVKADDAANGYALPYIEALKSAGVTDGYGEGTYNPAGKVTKEQLATFLVRVLGKDADAKAKTGTDATVSDWAQGYVALALDLKLLANGSDGKFGGQANATRDLLLTGAYEAKQQYVVPGKVSVTEAKATGVKTVVVSFSKPVDTDKAKVALTKGTTAIATTTKFADDKKSATLTITDTKLSAGEYTATISGLDAEAVDKTTAKFTATDESVTKIEFVNASDTVAYSNKASISLKATNQYGENASFSSGSYTVVAGNNGDVQPTLSKNDDGSLKITMNTKLLTNAQQNLSVIPVNVWFNDTHVSVSKNFTLGVAPFVTKLELGDVVYSNGTSINKKGETATIALKLYDQYGGLIGTDSESYQAANLNALFTPYESNLKVDPYVNTDHPNDPYVRAYLLNDLEKSGDYTLQVYYQGASATTKLAVKSAAVATKVAIGELSGVIASGDLDVYIPVLAYDEAGNQLSTDDLIADKNRDRIQLSVSGAGYEAKIMNSGDKKGQIHLTSVSAPAKSVVSVTAYIATANANSTASKTYTVADVRVPDHFKVATEPAKKIVPGTNSNSAFVVQTIDQYGSSRDNFYVTNSNGNIVYDANNGLTVTGNVYYYTRLTQTGTNNTNTIITTDGDQPATTAANFATLLGKNQSTVTLSNGVANKITDFDNLNNKYRFVALSGATGTMSFKVELIKVENATTGTKETVIDSVTRSIDIVNNSTDLTYSLNTVANLWNALDDVNNSIIVNNDYSNVADGGAGTILASDEKLPEKSKFARELTIAAKSASGDTVAYPKRITSITTSNPTVAQVKQLPYNATTNIGGDKAFVIGNKPGTATINVTFIASDGTQKQLSTTVTVKGDALTTDRVSNGNTGVQTFTLPASINAWTAMNLSAFDNYGVEYNKTTGIKYNNLLGVTFAVTNIKPITGTTVNSVSIDKDGNITTTGNVTFDVTAYAPNGKSVTTPFKVN